MKIVNRLKSSYIFGLIDGLNGAVGLIVSLSWHKAGSVLIITALLARAGSSAVSMGGAQYMADEHKDSYKHLRVVAMIGGYLTSALGTGVGFLFSQSLGHIVTIIVSVVCLAVIVYARSRTQVLWKALLVTLGIFGTAVGVGIGAALIS
jgi:hypothetical protein